MHRVASAGSKQGQVVEPLKAAMPMPLVSAVQAPEVLEGGTATTASDVYSFGMVRRMAWWHFLCWFHICWLAEGMLSASEQQRLRAEQPASSCPLLPMHRCCTSC